MDLQQFNKGLLKLDSKFKPSIFLAHKSWYHTALADIQDVTKKFTLGRISTFLIHLFRAILVLFLALKAKSVCIRIRIRFCPNAVALDRNLETYAFVKTHSLPSNSNVLHSTLLRKMEERFLSPKPHWNY